MLNIKILAAVTMVSALLLTGCQDNAEAAQTVRESVTAKQTEQTTEVSETTEETTSAETTQSVTETQLETTDFVYPDDPLTVENLLKIIKKAKGQIITSSGTNGAMDHRFGVVDIDFDGFPEIFCEFGYNSYDSSFYSLKEENFCEKLVDYNSYFDLYRNPGFSFECGNTVFYQKKEFGGDKSIIIYSNWSSHSHGASEAISEIKSSDGKFSYEEKFRSHWEYISRNDCEYRYEPDFFNIDGEKTDWENYEKKRMEYLYDTGEITPIDYVHEDISYWETQDYDELYLMYSVYVNNLKK